MRPSDSANHRSPELRRRLSDRWGLRAAIAIGVAVVAMRGSTAFAEKQACTTESECGVSNPCLTHRCVDGFCENTRTDCTSDNPCFVGVCNIQNGQCLLIPTELGTSCSDGQICNGEETCDGEGTCLAGTPPSVGTPCPDGKVCNGDETCDGEGTCLAGTPATAGTPCSDGNVCNGDETCDGAGACAAGEALDCNDGHDCTTDTCDPSTGCHNTVRQQGDVCRAATDSICDLEEVCDGTSLDCPADAHEPDGIQCTDGNPQTVGETCQAGICTCAGSDLDGDGIADPCDPVDATIVVKRAVAWPKRDKPAHIKAHGTLKTGVYGAADALDPSGGFTVRVTDGLTMDVSSSVAGALCRKSHIGTIDCRDDERIRLVFLPTRKTPGQYRWSLYLRNLDFVKPQAGPLTVTITDSHMIDRVGTAPMCRNAETGLPCR
jgi:hypothetical protein